MMKKVQLLFFGLLFFLVHYISADFDCESIENFSSTCNTELKCIYDEAYEQRTASCKCKVLINALSLPRLSYSLFEKVCFQNKNKLKQLELTDAELEFVDNQIFANYENLKYINLARNKLKMNFSEQAKGIRELDISFNELTLLKSNTLKQLKQLEILNMSFNKLEEISTLFKETTSLQEIFLNDNQLTTVQNNELGHLQKLRVLNLAHNLLVLTDNKLALENLQELYLNDNKLTSLDKDGFANLPNLRILDLSRNLLHTFSDTSELQSTTVRNLPSNFGFFIEIPPRKTTENSFSLSIPQNNLNNSFSNFQFANPYQSFADKLIKNQFNPASTFGNWNLNTHQIKKRATYVNIWSKLQELNLANNRIKEFPANFFSNLVELRKLNVSYNHLTTFELDRLSQSRKLTVFDVKGNHLNQLNLSRLKDRTWSLLQTVDFDINLINCDVLRNLLHYFRENEIILKSCTNASCCDQ